MVQEEIILRQNFSTFRPGRTRENTHKRAAIRRAGDLADAENGSMSFDFSVSGNIKETYRYPNEEGEERTGGRGANGTESVRNRD